MSKPKPKPKWMCRECTYENLGIMDYCEMCGVKPDSNSTQEQQREGPNALVKINNNNNNNDISADKHLYKVYYRGRLMIALPAGWVFWFAVFIMTRIIINVILIIWTTFFPQYTIVYTMQWAMCLMLALIVLCIITRLKQCWDKKYDPIPITKLPFMIILILVMVICTLMVFSVAIALNRNDINNIGEILTDHQIWLEALQFSVDNLKYSFDNLQGTVQAMDKKFTKWSKDLDDKYTKLLKEKEEVKKVEELASKMWEGFGLISITRQHFGLGCFVNGTLIQIDPFGNTKEIQDLNEFDMIYNPNLNRMVNIKRIVMGPEEYGYIYQFITNNSFKVSVTKTHPMKICHKVNDKNNNQQKNQRMECENIAASQVYQGSITQTINGYQEIMKINKIPANNVTVYNVMLDMDPYQPITQRTIIANKIHTFDLFAQAINE